MAKGSRVTWWAVLAVVVALLAACGSSGAKSASHGTKATEPQQATPEPDRDATLHVALGFGFTTLDPHSGPSFNMNWQSPVYDTLVIFDQFSKTGPKVAPWLAKSWTISPDGLTVTFTLRDDVTFQDGAKFDASVVKANIERSKSKFGANFLAKVESVEVKDPTHAVFHLSAREPALLNLMAITQTGGMIDPAAFATDLTKTPAGSGPYKLVSANATGDTIYDRWDGYWNKKAAYAKELILTTVADPNAAFNGVRAGTYDLASIVSPQLLTEARQAAGYHVVLTPAQNQVGIMLNTAKPPFNDQRVRQAVSMAFDRPLVAKQILQGLAPPAYQIFFPGQAGYDKRLDHAVYDLDKAKELVNAAGASGTTVEFLTQAAYPIDQLGQYVQQQLAKIGLNVKLTNVANSLFKTTWQKGQADGQVAAMSAGLDPSETLKTCCLHGLGSDNLGPDPDPVPTLATKGLDQPVGSAERARTYEQISKYYVDNPGNAIPLVGFWSGFVGRPNVIGTDQVQPVNLGRLLWTYVGKTK